MVAFRFAQIRDPETNLPCIDHQTVSFVSALVLAFPGYRDLPKELPHHYSSANTTSAWAANAYSTLHSSASCPISVAASYISRYSSSWMIRERAWLTSELKLMRFRSAIRLELS